jgi:hypothetical protein
VYEEALGFLTAPPQPLSGIRLSAP